MNEEKILRSPFNIDTHKKTFINYLEVIINEEGTIMYAVPSHQEKLIGIACNKFEITREELYEKCPREYYADLMTWLCNITGCISVWNEFKIGNPNNKQQKAIHDLFKHGLYRGS